MSEKVGFSQEGLLEMVRSRKYKQFATYIREIQNMNESAEESVAGVLDALLVRKTDKNPAVMLGGLMLYKTLMVSACLDYAMSEECFPQRIHDEVVRICEYNPTHQVFTARGNDYFVELFKVPKTEQTRETYERAGNSYVLMALELVQALASWYPEDFFNPKAKSYFRLKYEQLLAKKVTFPKKDQLNIIKKVDEDNFKANFIRFKQRMDEMELNDQPSPKDKKKEISKEDPKEQPKVQPVKEAPKDLSKKEPPKQESTVSNILKPSKIIKPEAVKSGAPGNAMNIEIGGSKGIEQSDEMIRIQGEVTSSIAVKHPQPQQRPQQAQQPKDPSLITTSNIFATNDNPESKRMNPTLSQNPKNPQPKIEEREIFSNSDSDQSVPPMPRQNSVKVIKGDSKPIPKDKVGENKERAALEARESKPAAPIVKPPDLTKPNQTGSEPKEIPKLPVPQPPKKEPQPPPAKQQFKKPESSIKDPKPAPKKETVQLASENAAKQGKQEIAPKDAPAGEISKPRQDANKPREEGKPHEGVEQAASLRVQEIGNPFSFGQFQQTARLDSGFRKMPKMEKAASNVNSVQPSPARADRAQQPSPRPRSLPKTEKRGKATAVNFYRVTQHFDAPLPFAAFPSGEQARTLADFARHRFRQLPSKQIEKHESVDGVLRHLRLDVRQVPFVEKYFEPVKPSMRALRQQALTVFNGGASGNAFFTSGTVEGRLVKEGSGVYSLALRNVSGAPLVVEHAEMKGVRFANRIKILSWANRPEIAPYEVPRNGFIDIRFRFVTHDLNFKFLPFLLRLNGALEHLLLPVTLLDHCQLAPLRPSTLHSYALSGSVLLSRPFPLAIPLPPFLGGFRFHSLSNSRQREDGQVVGECSVRWEGEGDEAGVEVLARVVDWQKQLLEFSIVYSKDSTSQDLAKVLLYLLVFLLQAD